MHFRHSPDVFAKRCAVFELTCQNFLNSAVILFSPAIVMSQISDDEREELDAMRRAMETPSSPSIFTPVRQKRRLPNASDSEDGANDNLDETSTPTGTDWGIASSLTLSATRSPADNSTPVAAVNKNISVNARKYAQKKRLRTDQIAEVDVFLTVI